MSAFFDLPSFFRRVSNPLLQRYSADTTAFADFDWASAGVRKTAPIMERFNLATPEDRRKALDVFRRVESLASATGTQVLIEVSRDKAGGVAATLAAMARTDALTGLPNRHWLNDYLPGALERARAGSQRLALLYLDLDNFKDINEFL